MFAWRSKWKDSSNPYAKEGIDKKMHSVIDGHSSQSGFRTRPGRLSCRRGCPHGSCWRSTVDVLPASGPRLALTHSLTHSLTSPRHLIARLSPRRLVRLPVRGTQTGRSVSDHRRPLAAPPQPSADPISITSPERSEGMRPSRACVPVLCPRLGFRAAGHETVSRCINHTT